MGPGFKRKIGHGEEWHAISTGFGSQQKRQRRQEPEKTESESAKRWKDQGEPYYGDGVKPRNPMYTGRIEKEPLDAMASHGRMIELS